MTNTQTNTTALEQAEQIATEVAQASAFDYAGNYGRGTFRFAIDVRRSRDTITFSATVNAVIRKEQAREELKKFWDAFVARMTEQGIASQFVMPRTRGKLLHLQGMWHMGHFCIDGIARQIKTK